MRRARRGKEFFRIALRHGVSGCGFQIESYLIRYFREIGWPVRKLGGRDPERIKIIVAPFEGHGWLIQPDCVACVRLIGRDNVILTPHTAFYSVEALEELQTKCAADVARVLSGEKPVYPVKAA